MRTTNDSNNTNRKNTHECLSSFSVFHPCPFVAKTLHPLLSVLRVAVVNFITIECVRYGLGRFNPGCPQQSILQQLLKSFLFEIFLAPQ